MNNAENFRKLLPDENNDRMCMCVYMSLNVLILLTFGCFSICEVIFSKMLNEIVPFHELWYVCESGGQASAPFRSSHRNSQSMHENMMKYSIEITRKWAGGKWRLVKERGIILWHHHCDEKKTTTKKKRNGNKIINWQNYKPQSNGGTIQTHSHVHICITHARRASNWADEGGGSEKLIQLTLLDGIQIKVKHSNERSRRKKCNRRTAEVNAALREPSRTRQMQKTANFTTPLFTPGCRYYLCVCVCVLYSGSSWV